MEGKYTRHHPQTQNRSWLSRWEGDSADADAARLQALIENDARFLRFESHGFIPHWRENHERVRVLVSDHKAAGDKTNKTNYVGLRGAVFPRSPYMCVFVWVCECVGVYVCVLV